MGKSPELEGEGIPATAARSAIELWEVFSERGGLVPDTHDKALFDELRARLGVPPGKSIPEHLRDAKLSATDFLIALLGATGPWALMISGIYAMFERHGLVQSNEGVLLEFDFKRDEGQLRFSTSHFKRAAAIYGQLTQLVESKKFVASDLHDLLNVVPRLLAKANGLKVEAGYGYESVPIGVRNGTVVKSSQDPESPEMHAWLEPSWPFRVAPPLPPHTDDLSDAMGPLRNAAALLCARTAVYRDMDEMLKAAHADKTRSGIGDQIKGFIGDWKLSKALFSQHDRLGPNLARVAWHVHEMAPSEAAARAELAKDIRDAIDERSESAPRQVSDSVLEDLLDLPLWKHRHQMYSIWLLTIVERALPKEATFTLQHEDGKLSFSFSTTVVAKVATGRTKLEWIAELRTEARNFALAGEGRKEAVQPDYVLRYEGNENSVFYVLEAKQYRKGDTKNFSQALYDYAGVHRDAKVVLVNYGSVSRTMEAALATLIEDMQRQEPRVLRIGARCKTFANVRPDAGIEVEALRRDIVEVMESVVENDLPRLLVDVTGSMTNFLPEEPGAGGKLWELLESWNAPLLLVADRMLDELPAREAVNLAKHIRSRAVSSTLAIRSVPSHLRDGAVLLTDEAGFHESSGEHRGFSIIIVMTTPAQARVIYGMRDNGMLLLDLEMTGCATFERW